MAKFADLRRLPLITCALAALLGGTAALAAPDQDGRAETKLLSEAAEAAEAQLHQSFTNLQFEEFGPAPVKGAIYQAVAGGRIIYYAPASEHILFATVYDKNGINITALAQEASTAKRLKLIDPAKALVIGPAGAPTVIEFTDPDCPYCRALDKFWAAKAAEGKPEPRPNTYCARRTRRLRSARSTPALPPKPLKNAQTAQLGSPRTPRSCASSASPAPRR